MGGTALFKQSVRLEYKGIINTFGMEKGKAWEQENHLHCRCSARISFVFSDAFVAGREEGGGDGNLIDREYFFFYH